MRVDIQKCIETERDRCMPKEESSRNTTYKTWVPCRSSNALVGDARLESTVLFLNKEETHTNWEGGRMDDTPLPVPSGGIRP